jgi:DNA replication protein DnaC
MHPQLEAKLKQIRLSGMVQTLPARLAQAQAANLTHLEFLEILVADELAVRADRLYARRLKHAGITELKDFADFNWNFNPQLPRVRLCDLATARFITTKTNVLLVGPPGVGKSHCVTAIAIGAIRAGYRVLIKNIFTLADELIDAEATGQRRELVHQLSTVDLLVLEDFGMKTLRASAAEDLLDIIMRRHERLPTFITTNRPTEDWAHFLADVPAATAILDRFLHHVEIVLMQGRSYRLVSQIASDASTTCSADSGGPSTPSPSGGARQPAPHTSDLEPLRSPLPHVSSGSRPPATPRTPPQSRPAASPPRPDTPARRRKAKQSSN